MSRTVYLVYVQTGPTSRARLRAIRETEGRAETAADELDNGRNLVSIREETLPAPIAGFTVSQIHEVVSWARCLY